MPLKVGDIVELTIDDVAFGGDGVARVAKCVVFVPFTLRAERVRAQIVSGRKNFATAQLQEVLEPSEHRVLPVCPHFGASAKPLPCGGCQYQHIAYDEQVKLKTAQVRDALERIGGIKNPPVSDTIASPNTYSYRNKITVRRCGRALGYLAVDNKTLLNIVRCPIADESINAALANLRTRFLRESASTGKTNEMDITIRHTSTGQVSWFVESDEATSAQPSSTMWVEELALGKRLKLPPSSFFQVNAGVLPKMIGLVRDIFEGGNCSTAVDAYCGVGLFAIFLADAATMCYGIESDALAISAAKFNAERLGLGNCIFSAATVAEELPRILDKINAANCCVILDPPRAGCERKVIEMLCQHRPKQIIYISCHPPALARDLKLILGENRYELRQVVPLDMFPQTSHCEVVAELARR